MHFPARGNADTDGSDASAVVPQPERAADTVRAMTTIAPTPPRTSLDTWVTVVPINNFLAETCEQYGLVVPKVLLVMSTTRGPEALADKVKALGLPSPTDPKSGANPIVRAVEESITDFSRQHPDRLLGRSGTGSPATDVDENGARFHVWADIESHLRR